MTANVLMSKRCYYHSNKNCFIYLSNKEKGLFQELDVVQIENDLFKAYLSVSFINSGKNDEDICFLNGIYAKKLKINEGNEISIVNRYRDKKYANDITLEPISKNDWEILELNTENIQNNLLNQIRVVYKDQIFPIWIESSVFVFVKISTYTPNSEPFLWLNNFTKVFVAPPTNKLEKPAKSCSPSALNRFFGTNKEYKSDKDILEYFSNGNWSQSFKIKKLSDDFSSKCSTLTSIYIKKSVLKKLDLEIDESKSKFIVAVSLVDSPMTNVKAKDTIKRIINCVENSYPVDYINKFDSKKQFYALMSVLDDVDDSTDIELSEYLIQQYELSRYSKLLVKTVTSTEYNNLKKSEKMVIRTSCDNVQRVKNAFLRFVDENSFCLCPLVFTNLQIIELKTDPENEKLICQIFIDNDFITVNSNTIQNTLTLVFDYNQLYSDLKLPSNESFNKKHFQIQVCESKWFNSNLNSILEHIRKNLFLTDKTVFCHSLVLQGSKGSGKSLICKHICNLLTTQHENLFYQYVNCQYFMGKSVDSFYDQLKLIYEEAIWCNNSIIILDNLDFLLESANAENDPKLKLYCYQLIEVMKEVMLQVWQKHSRVLTIATTTNSINELPALFHCLDEHGLFTTFLQIQTTMSSDIIEIVKNLLLKRNIVFDEDLLAAIGEHMEGFVFKDIERFIEKILFSQYSKSQNNVVHLKDVKDIIYDYTSITMLETNLLKSNTFNWNLIGGLQEIKKTLNESIIWPIKYEKLYKELGMKQSAGVLLYGPSGCGKTIIASALANESKLNFISVKGPELLSKYIGSSEHNVRELFRKAEKAKPCVIFFDEFDSIAPKRGHDSTGVTDRVVNQLLTQLDGVESLDGVYLLAATSRPDLIDQALLRPGRIDNSIYIGFPSANEIHEIIKIYSKKIKFDTDVDLQEIAELCDTFTGADIKALVCDALIRAFHRLFDDKTDKSKQNNLLFYNMKTNEDDDLLSKIVINKLDLLSSVKTIQKSFNKGERQKMNKLYENWKNTKTLTSEDSGERKLKATLA